MIQLTKHKEALRKILLRPETRHKFRDLAKSLHASKDELNAALNALRAEGMKILYSRLDRSFYVSTVPTPYSDYFDMMWMPTEGILGAISDTHLCSVAERLDAMEKTYDRFQKEGVKTVLHCGDITDGWHVYKGHVQFVKVGGAQKQAIYAKKHYPRRKGITTFFIGGNHDMRSFEETGVDQCSLIVNSVYSEGKDYPSRDDLVYLGQYSRFLMFPNNVSVQLLHPRGGGSYAKSYPQQRRAREMKTDTRPNLQISGHLHTWNWTQEDITDMISLPGLQDETEFFVRQGYRRDLGFALIEYKLGNGRFSSLKVEKVPVE